MKYNSHLLWRMLFFISTVWLITDFTEAGTADCKNADLNDLNHQAKKFSQCFLEMLPNKRTEINALAWSLQQVLDRLREVQGKACNAFMTKNCSVPEAPKNGGLVCISIDSVHYCKPMCNQGYDFGFLRRSRVSEKCGASTGYSWTTQLVGGNRLADCISSPIAVSGVKSAYFPAHMCCQQTIANATAEREQIEIFLRELAEAEKDVSQEHEMANHCILCGN
ncbi:uncharacterized protein LOC142047796 [Chelonoidis abingdonii]|uniref:uncharacterized protein LOC142047796 n=1 Tax=Chelonoidis abingdonii TaxID=106734 RepID=UPI003F496722